jgi:hypothetical protein
MARRSDSNPSLGLEKLVTGLPAAEYVMNVTVVYEDSHSHKWAREIYQHIEAQACPKAVRGTWWNVVDLLQPGVLAGAVSTAIRSDIIVVSVSGSEGLPLPFYFWVNSWLPHRPFGSGALVALLGAPLLRNSQSGRLRKYLRAVAKRARMDLLVAERPLGDSIPFIRFAH